MPAADSTQVLVWYSSTGIHFGIRAFEAHGAVHATLADRDRIAADDYVQILLSTFNDGRQATVFAVNPFGVQSDGALVETGSTSGNGFNNAVVKREVPDLSPDYVFESKGRLTDMATRSRSGFRSRASVFSPRRSRAGESTSSAWCSTPARRTPGPRPGGPAPRSWRSRGRLVGLTDLRRGLVLDVTPVVTSKATGTGGTAGWELRRGTARAGRHRPLGSDQQPDPQRHRQSRLFPGGVRRQQFTFDPRNELFFSEKRPFFLDGIEQFTTPNNLIYTRRMVQPVAAAKLTGKALAPTRAPHGRGRSGRLRHRRRSSDLQPAPGPAGHRRPVPAWPGLHRQDRRRQLQPGGGSGRPLVFGDVYSAQFSWPEAEPAQRVHHNGAALVGPVWCATGRTFGSGTPSPALPTTSGPAAASSPGPGSCTPTSTTV